MSQFKLLAALLVLASLVLFGCTSSNPFNANSFNGGSATGTAAGFQQSQDFAVSTAYNNSTSATYALYYAIPTHSWELTYAGSVPNSTVAFQGSLDNVTYTTLDTYSGNTSSVRFVTGEGIKYARFVITNWAGAANITQGNLSIHYTGIAG